jgi:transcriptional regulator with XRE-family HTH domain
MPPGQGSDNQLAERLKELRRTGLERKLTQQEVAAALGGSRPLSTALISSWENGKAVPTEERIHDYVRVFGEADPQGRRQLEQELLELRRRADAASGDGSARGSAGPATAGGMWHFPDGEEVCVIGSRLPDEVISTVPYADFRHPNHIALLHFADADAVVEIFGHIRAVNPNSRVTFKTVPDLVDDDWSKHVVLLGGDWNDAAQWYRRRVDLPVEFVDPSDESDFDGFFQVTVLDPPHDFKPTFVKSPADVKQLEYDVGLFARSPNPANPDATLTLCQGIFSRGTYGLVRMFTDVLHRHANEAALAEIHSGFGEQRLEWLLVRVPVALGNTVTPNLSRPYLQLAVGSRDEARLLEGAREGARPEI